MYNKRDWTALGLGWISAFGFYVLVPEFPAKVFFVFIAGFITAFMIRGLS